MMERRTFLGVIAGGLLAAPLAAEAQQAGKMWRIGLLDYAASEPADEARWKALCERLRELGYVEGQNVTFEPRWANGQVGRLPGLAVELIDAKVDIIDRNRPERSGTRGQEGNALNPYRHCDERRPSGAGSRRKSGTAGRKCDGCGVDTE